MTTRFNDLSRRNIRRLKPGERITEHGITAERLADGDVKYVVAVMVDGRRVHRVIGKESEGVTRTQAELFVEAKRTEAREGRLSLPVGRKTALTFKRAATDYVTRLEETGGKNLTAKRRQLRLYLTPFFGSQRLDTITAFTVDRYKKRRKDAGAANGTINRELAILSHLFSKAVEWRWIKVKPCPVRKLSESKGRIVVLSDDEADALLRAAIADEDAYLWLFVAFGLNTAMRHGEILRARFDHLDFERRRLFIPQAKAGGREQPITPELSDILRKERETSDSAWIFPTLRPKLTKHGHRLRMTRAFSRAVVRAGLDPAQVTPHVMRHTGITNLVEAGVDLPTIQRISGHKTLAMVLRYTHVHGCHIDQAIRAIGRGLPEPIASVLWPPIHSPGQGRRA